MVVGILNSFFKNTKYKVISVGLQLRICLIQQSTKNGISKARSRKPGPFPKTKQRPEQKFYLLPSRSKKFVTGESNLSISHRWEPETPLEPARHRGCKEGKLVTSKTLCDTGEKALRFWETYVHSDNLRLLRMKPLNKKRINIPKLPAVVEAITVWKTEARKRNIEIDDRCMANSSNICRKNLEITWAWSMWDGC